MTLAVPPQRIHLPAIGAAPEPIEAAEYPGGMNVEAWTLARLIMTDERQERMVLRPDTVLARLAQDKASDMQRRRYFSHTTPDGITINELARSRGIGLPEWYHKTGNNIETIAGNQQTAPEVVEAVWGSDGHREHVFGQLAFFSNQTRLGCGYAERRDGQEEFSTIWVVLTV